MSGKNELSNYHQLGGVLYKVGDAVNKTKDPKKKPFYILEFVLEVRENYYGKPVSTFAKFEIKDEDKFKMLDTYEIGDPIVVTFRVSGRKWKPDDGEERIFNSLVVSSITRMPEQLSFEDNNEKEKEEKHWSDDFFTPSSKKKEIDDDEDLGLPF